MLRVIFFLLTQLCLSILAIAGPKDSLRIERRDANTFIIHRVVKNENLAVLAKRYGVEEASILSNNPLVTDKLVPGQLLKVPLNTQKYANMVAPEVKPLTISPLPTATSLPIASETKPIEQKAAASNELTKQEVVKGSGRPIASFNTYVVSSPQTVQQVANTFMVEPNDIIKENDLQNYRLKAGQKIKIPVYADAPIAAEKAPLVQTVTQKEQNELRKEVPVVTAKVVETPKPAAQVAPKAEKKEAPKPLPEIVTAKFQKEEPPMVAETTPLNKPDTLTAAQRKRKAAMANIDFLDSTYIHPDGVVYKLFDYRQMDYQFDTKLMRIAEENAIEVEGVDQRPGFGNKKTIHVVKREESLQSIALKYKVSATDIINWNGMLNYRVREGQELVINSERANISPYERTVVKQSTVKPSSSFYERTVKGFAYYDAKKTFKGVYVNDVEKGKFITIQNRDNYEKTIARVIGPLPAGLPKGTIILIDTPTAKDLKVENEKINIQIWFDAVKEEVEAAAQELK